MKNDDILLCNNKLNIDGYNSYDYDRKGLIKELLNRDIEYHGVGWIRSGYITNITAIDKKLYIDVLFDDKTVYSKIQYHCALSKGIIKVYETKRTPGEKKTKDHKKHLVIENPVSKDILDIFEEEQLIYGRHLGHKRTIGGCFGEDDRESEFYNSPDPEEAILSAYGYHICDADDLVSDDWVDDEEFDDDEDDFLEEILDKRDDSV